MTRKSNLKPVAAAVGAALVGSLSAVNLASAADNPFGASPLQGGYMQLASSHEGEKEQAGEGKEMKEGKCGEGKCGGDMKMKEGESGEDKAMKEGKCGEGKCGGNMEEKKG